MNGGSSQEGSGTGALHGYGGGEILVRVTNRGVLSPRPARWGGESGTVSFAKESYTLNPLPYTRKIFPTPSISGSRVPDDER